MGTKSSKQRVAIAVIWGIVALMIGGLVVHYLGDADERRGSAVVERVAALAKTKRSVPVRDLTDFDFDRFVVVDGAALMNIDHALGFHWRRSDSERPKCCEPPPLWAFVKGHTVVAYARPDESISYGDCTAIGRKTVWRPNDRLALAGCRAQG